MSSGLKKRIVELDYAQVSLYEVAVLIEQVFKDTSLTADTGPLPHLHTILERYTHAVREGAEPELHQRMGNHLEFLKVLSSQLDEKVRRMEGDLRGRHG
jgi:hypothetical protein